MDTFFSHLIINMDHQLIITIFIFILLLYLLILTHSRECLEHTSLVDIEYFKFWNFGKGEKEMFDTYFKYIFQDLAGLYKIRVYSVFDGNLPSKEAGILNVQFSGESRYENPELFDLNLIPEPFSRDPFTIPTLLGGMHLYLHDLLHKSFRQRNFFSDIKVRRKFCSFVVSNGSASDRIRFFHQLNKYRDVDSCGRWNNNVDFQIPDINSQEYYEFIGGYKFQICFENVQKPWYFTEKLINAYIGGCIPIYMGSKNVGEFLNTNAFVWIKDSSKKSFSKAINQIIEMDTNDQKYRVMYEEHLFRDNILPSVMDINNIRLTIGSHFLNNI